MRQAPNSMPADRSRATPGRRRSRLGWILLIVLGAAGLGFTYWYNHRPDASGGPRSGGFRRFAFGAGMGMSMPVVAAKAQKEPIDIYLNGLGTVTPLATVTLRSQISGQIREIHFQEGQEVKKGDLLVVIDDRPYQVAKEQAQGQYAQAQAQLKQAQLDLERYETLAKEDSIAQQQVDAEKALVSQYQGLSQTAKAAMDSADLNIRYCHIQAPVDGRVGLRLVDIGNYVTPGDASGLVVLTELKPMSVIFTLPEDNVTEVAKRLHSGAQIPVDAFDRTMSHRIASGTLATIDNEVDTATGTVRLRALFPNDDEALFANEFVNARMLLNVEQNAVVVPSSSIERGQTGTFVYVVKDDNTVTAVPVTLGVTQDEKQAIASGLSGGELVVSDGADKLKEGMHVTVQQPGAPAAAPAAARRGPAKGHWSDADRAAWKAKHAAP